MAKQFIDVIADSYDSLIKYKLQSENLLLDALKESAVQAASPKDVLAIVDGVPKWYSGYVPYIGAKDNVNLGNYGLIASYILFNTSATPASPVEGLLQWNSTDGTVDLSMAGGAVTQQIGQELFIKVWNDSGATIPNGKAVYFDGRQGNRPKIYLAKSDSTLTCNVMGLTTMDIPDGTEGFITPFGYVRQLKTDYSGWAEGDNLYISNLVAGELLNEEPPTPHHADIIGKVGIVGGHGIGSIFVNIIRHKALEELSDVNGTLLDTTGQIVMWDEARKVFDFNYNILDVHNATKDPTGFIDNNDIVVTYDDVQRQITLSKVGEIEYFWRGLKYTLPNPWISVSHPTGNGQFFLYSNNGVNFTWTNNPWKFTDVMIAAVAVGTTYKVVIAEAHGVMPVSQHASDHANIGTKIISGGLLTADTYLENTPTDAANSFALNSAILQDEDRMNTCAATTDGQYTTMRIGAANTPVFDSAAVLPFRSSGSYLLVNNPATGAETAGTNNRYYNVYALWMPVALGTESQKYRVVLIQPQREFTSLASAQAEDIRGIALGSLTNISPEFVFGARITYITAAGDLNTGKCRIATGGISYVTGSRTSSTSLVGALNHNPVTIAINTAEYLEVTNEQVVGFRLTDAPVWSSAVVTENELAEKKLEWLQSVANCTGGEAGTEPWNNPELTYEGASAYEIAVLHGFVGTEEQWLASLQGEDGISAYQVAVNNGFVGTEAEWLLSIKGEKGDMGYGIGDHESTYDHMAFVTDTEMNEILGDILTILNSI